MIFADCPAKEYHGTCHWNFIRKMASSFSWDWVSHIGLVTVANCSPEGPIISDSRGLEVDWYRSL